MNIKLLFSYTAFAVILFTQQAQAQQQLSANRGHSHNDYKQNIPLLSAYYAGMGSIEADVFLREGKLFVAHEEKEISSERTLSGEYLQPLYKLFRKNNNHPYSDPALSLQLVVDIKEDYQHVLPALLKELAPVMDMVKQGGNQKGISIVVSGDMPPPTEFSRYPGYIGFDGRPATVYTVDQLRHIAMISDELTKYTPWNGKGTPTPGDTELLKKLIEDAHKKGKPFRFWATQDSPNTWIELERLGVDWINTDHPEKVQQFYQNREKLSYTNPVAYPVYTPTYKSDGLHKRVKNVILLIGDGMGLAQIHAGWIANHGSLNMTMLRNSGFSQTAAANSGNTDSAAGASAMATGEKTNNRYIGMGTDDKKRTNLPDTLSRYGVTTGIITSGDVTDATPAAFYAHQLERTLSGAIARDLSSRQVDILVGSNRKAFMENPDEKLMTVLKDKGYTLSNTMSAFKQQKEGKQLVLLADSATRAVKDGRGDFLVQALRKTTDLLAGNKKGFFIMAEGAQIDYGGHANDLKYVVTELHDFDRMVEEAIRFADKDGETLVIITADHETGGLTLLSASAAQGSISGEFSTNDHTNIMVPVYAYGPWSDAFRGTYPNNEIFTKMLSAFGRK